MIGVPGRLNAGWPLLAVQVNNQELETIEGMAQDGQLHPLQEGFLMEHGLQCGFCTPGMLMSSKALVDADPSPSEAEIRRGISGNLCRCTGYVNIVKAVQYGAAKLRGENPVSANLEPVHA